MTDSLPIIGIVMGSDSDLPTMQAAIDAVQEFGFPVEVRILSAHRTPDEMLEWARTADERRIGVVIAGAGGAAHLPGMLAAVTPLPVIGVPVVAAAMATLGGVDALLSIVQMPAGVPVAAVAIGNARNAGLLAVRMIGASNPAVRGEMKKFQTQLHDNVVARDRLVAERFATLGRPD
jgi:5-(carboxyamino)imidazole ribonucleotide mutase